MILDPVLGKANVWMIEKNLRLNWLTRRDYVCETKVKAESIERSTNFMLLVFTRLKLLSSKSNKMCLYIQKIISGLEEKLKWKI